MALKIPGCNERIHGLWKTVETANPGLSQRKWAQDHGLDSTKFNNWTKKTQPDFEGLEQLQRVFGIPWQWILIGDEGMAVLETYRQKKHPHGQAKSWKEIYKP